MILSLAPILLLFLSNLFMTTAWYWHLKYHHLPIWQVILISWGIALIEYCLAVPANRLGSRIFSAAELKTIQEVVTLLVFAGFAFFYLGEKLTLMHGIGFAFIALGAAIVFFAKP
jgi:uncharacterized protein (DUF486 family)